MAGRRTRVLVVDHVSKVLGGAEVNVLELLDQPGAREAWDVAAACAPGSPLAARLAAQGWPVHPHAFAPELNELRVVGRRFNPVAQLRGWQELQRASHRLQALVRETRPDVLLSCTNKDHFAAGAASRALGIAQVWWVNDILSADFFGWPVRKMFVARTRASSPQLAAVSEFGRAALVREGVPAGRVTTVHNGIPLERYRRDPARPLRRQLGLAEGTPLFGVVGRLTPWKGQEIFLRVAQAWAAAGRPGHFAVMGGAFNEDAPYARHLRDFVRDHGLGERVTFVPFAPDVAALLSSLDALLHTSTKPEPFGRVLIEAMAAEVPVIAARAGGVPEIVTHGRDGLLVPPGDVAGYGNALRRMMESTEERAGWVREARRAVAERFPMSRVLADFRGLLERAVRERGGR
ncbi:MAG: glycosyltransferase family 4 protein [Verrucomicrobiota bacterium]